MAFSSLVCFARFNLVELSGNVLTLTTIFWHIMSHTASREGQFWPHVPNPYPSQRNGMNPVRLQSTVFNVLLLSKGTGLREQQRREQ
jgi:hypothetical protein